MKSKKFSLLLAALFAFSSYAKIDTLNSTIQWTGTKKVGQESHTGSIQIKSAHLKEENGQLTGGELTIDMNSISTSDLQAGKGKEKLDAHLKNEDFFDVQKFPEAKLKIKAVKGQKITADVTIKGKTQELSFPFQKEGDNYTGSLSFDRTKFGIVYGSGNIFKELAIDRIINDQIKLDFTVKKIVTK